MPGLSVAILAHNEERFLEDALKSVVWAEEIVVVDASSTDATGDIARKFGAKVLVRPNIANLNVNKNIAIRACTNQWALILDADERIPDPLAGEIRKVIADDAADGFLIPRRNYVLGRWIWRGSQYPDWQLRLVRRDRARFGERHVHERINVQGRVAELTNPMEHHPYPDVAALIRKKEFYARFEAGLLIEKGVKISFIKLVFFGFIGAAIRFIRRYFFKGGFLDGGPGLVNAYFDAWNVVLRWILAWEHNQRMKEHR